MPRRSPSAWHEVTHLVAAFEALAAAFARSTDPSARRLAEALAVGLGPGRAAVAAGENGQWVPGLLLGLRQGGRELSDLLEMLPDSERPRASGEVARAGGTWLAALLDGSGSRSAAILRRGRIDTEDEYYCVRARVDQLEAAGDSAEECQHLNALLDGYEIRPPGHGDGAAAS